MAVSVMMKIVSVAVMCMMMSAPSAEAAMTCSTVINNLRPCLNFLINTVPKAPPACCTGVQTLFKAATTTVDRQTACRCMKSTASSVSGINLKNAASLPSACGVTIPYKISPSTDCDKVQ